MSQSDSASEERHLEREDYLALYAQAEDAIKFADRISGESSLPAVNQLRYAGRHFAENDLIAATSHCLRARYDAYEAAIVFLLKYYAEFNSRHYTSETLDKYLPRWKDYRAAFIRDRLKLERVRSMRDVSSDELTELESVLSGLIEMRDAITGAYNEIDADLARLEEAERRRIEQERQDQEEARAREDRRRYSLSLWWTICGTILGALGLLIAFVK